MQKVLVGLLFFFVFGGGWSVTDTARNDQRFQWWENYGLHEERVDYGEAHQFHSCKVLYFRHLFHILKYSLYKEKSKLWNPLTRFVATFLLWTTMAYCLKALMEEFLTKFLNGTYRTALLDLVKCSAIFVQLRAFRVEGKSILLLLFGCFLLYLCFLLLSRLAKHWATWKHGTGFREPLKIIELRRVMWFICNQGIWSVYNQKVNSYKSATNHSVLMDLREQKFIKCVLIWALLGMALLGYFKFWLYLPVWNHWI